MPEYTSVLTAQVANPLIPQLSRTTVTFNASNTTAIVPLFIVTGCVEVLALWGVVTTALSSNHTAAYFHINDAVATPDITLATGVTLSSAPAGSVIVKKGLATAASVALSNAAGVVSEPTTLETTYFSPFVVVANGISATNLEYIYTTTNTPATGEVQFFVRWMALSATGKLEPTAVPIEQG